MISRLDPQNCIGVYMFADAYGHQELRERSQDYIRKKVGFIRLWEHAISRRVIRDNFFVEHQTCLMSFL